MTVKMQLTAGEGQLTAEVARDRLELDERNERLKAEAEGTATFKNPLDDEGSDDDTVQQVRPRVVQAIPDCASVVLRWAHHVCRHITYWCL